MLGIFVAGGQLGIIIVVMEEDFPGWDKMIFCVVADIIPAAIINEFLLPPEAFIIGYAVGA